MQSVVGRNRPASFGKQDPNAMKQNQKKKKKMRDKGARRVAMLEPFCAITALAKLRWQKVWDMAVFPAVAANKECEWQDC